jgi:hypothetical protein
MLVAKPVQFTITQEATNLLQAIVAVEKDRGKDARKARILANESRLLLVKLSTISPAVKLLLDGKAKP